MNKYEIETAILKEFEAFLPAIENIFYRLNGYFFILLCHQNTSQYNSWKTSNLSLTSLYFIRPSKYR